MRSALGPCSNDDRMSPSRAGSATAVCVCTEVCTQAEPRRAGLQQFRAPRCGDEQRHGRQSLLLAPYSLLLQLLSRASAPSPIA